MFGKRKFSCHVEVHKERTLVQLSIHDQTNSRNCEKTGTSNGLRDRLDGHRAEELVYLSAFSSSSDRVAVKTVRQYFLYKLTAEKCTFVSPNNTIIPYSYQFLRSFCGEELCDAKEHTRLFCFFRGWIGSLGPSLSV